MASIIDGLGKMAKRIKDSAAAGDDVAIQGRQGPARAGTRAVHGRDPED